MLMCNNACPLLVMLCFRGIIAHWARKAHPIPLLVFQDRIDKVNSRAK